MAMSCDRVVRVCVLVIALAVLLRDVASFVLREAGTSAALSILDLSHHFVNAAHQPKLHCITLEWVIQVKNGENV